MKKKILFILLSVLIIAGLSACSVKSEDAAGTTESTAINSTVSESTTEKEETESETTTQKNEVSDTTTTRPADQKSAGQTTTKKVTATQNQTNDKKQTAAQSQTTTQKVTTTKKQNVTQKQTTTKKVTTTAKQNKLSKSDVDWVQSQAHAYIKSKGMSVNSSVSSFSYRTSSYNYTNKNELLSDIKNTIDYEYSECINSGWKKVDMYVSVSADGDGDYWLVVMYG